MKPIEPVGALRRIGVSAEIRGVLEVRRPRLLHSVSNQHRATACQRRVAARSTATFASRLKSPRLRRVRLAEPSVNQNPSAPYASSRAWCGTARRACDTSAPGWRRRDAATSSLATGRLGMPFFSRPNASLFGIEDHAHRHAALRGREQRLDHVAIRQVEHRDVDAVAARARREVAHDGRADLAFGEHLHVRAHRPAGERASSPAPSAAAPSDHAVPARNRAPAPARSRAAAQRGALRAQRDVRMRAAGVVRIRRGRRCR